MVFGSGQGGGIGSLLSGGGFMPRPQQQGGPAPQFGGLGALAQSLLEQMMLRQQLGGAIDRRAAPPMIEPPMRQGAPIGVHSPRDMFGMNASTEGTRGDRLGDPGYGDEPYPPGGPYGQSQPATPPPSMPEPTPEERRIERHMQDIAPDPARQQEINRLMNEIDYLMSQPDSPEKMDRIMTIQQEIERLKSGQ